MRPGRDGLRATCTQVRLLVLHARRGTGPVTAGYSLRLEHRLQRVYAPARVLVADEDGLTAPSITRRYSELLGAAPLTTISRGGVRTQHLVVLQEPDQIARTVFVLAGRAVS